MRQLRELRFGAVGTGPSGNSFTANGFRTILKSLGEMPQLTVLEMQLPVEKGLYIGTFCNK